MDNDYDKNNPLYVPYIHSLRDQIAMRAMVALMNPDFRMFAQKEGGDEIQKSTASVSTAAYCFADAMLKARNTGGS